MSDIRSTCPLKCCCKSFTDYIIGDPCDGEKCIRYRAYQQGREGAINEALDRLSCMTDTKHGEEHFLFGIETCREILEQMKETK